MASGTVYVGSEDRILYAFDAATSAKRWIRWTGYGPGIDSSPAVAGSQDYIVAGNAEVYALNSATGARQWVFTTGNNFILSSPAVASGTVYVGTGDGDLYALNAATGTRLWPFAAGAPVWSSPAVANGVVYIGSEDGKLYAFSLAGGFTTPARPAPAGPACTPTTTSGPRPPHSGLTARSKWSFCLAIILARRRRYVIWICPAWRFGPCGCRACVPGPLRQFHRLVIACVRC